MRHSRVRATIGVLLAVLLVGATAGSGVAAASVTASQPDTAPAGPERADGVDCSVPAPFSAALGGGYLVAAIAWLSGESIFPRSLC